MNDIRSMITIYRDIGLNTTILNLDLAPEANCSSTLPFIVKSRGVMRIDVCLVGQ